MSQSATGSRGAPSYASVAASSSSTPATAVSSSARPNMPRQRSRGQIARRHSITRGSDVRSVERSSASVGITAEQVLKPASQAEQQKSKRYARSRIVPGSSTRGISSNRLRNAAIVSGAGGERPWLGGLYFTDVVFIAFTYTVNLLRTLGLAELADVVIKGCVYALTQLPFDLYRRWSLSTPPYSAKAPARKNAAKIRRRKKRRNRMPSETALTSSSESDPFDVPLSSQPPVFASSHEDEPSATVVEQLSPFHHLVILLSKFACGNFPHLLPRVLFAEETIGPFVYWRTGGGSNAMVQEFTDLTSERKAALLKGAPGSSAIKDADAPPDQSSFRAYLLSKDARMPIEVQRANLAARRATTLLYLHGGGFSLGSVAFYAEPLLRLRAKIALLESDEPYDVHNPIAEARCVAVEYDLSPTARFPLPLLQCLRCYAHLIEVEKVDADSICIAGDSAGGNLAMGMLLCLDGQMRDDPLLAERDWSLLPMPGKAMLISPWVDLRPSKAHAFSNLRRQAGVSPTSKRGGGKATEEASSSSPKTTSERAADAWTEAVAQYDWDYVASESLLHFAQVYAGVLPLPRRVHGPLGWIAHVCGVLALQYDGMIDEESAAAPKGFMDPSRALSVLSRPSRRLARATHHALNDPILPRLLGLNVEGGGERSDHVVTRSDSITAGFEPLFTQSERRTDVVANASQLYESIEGPLSTSGADKIGVDHASTQARLRGRHLLDTHALLSPATGDWSRIKLKHGCLVTWGERERMADDIEAWVDSMGAQGGTSAAKTDAPPAPDGQAHVVAADDCDAAQTACDDDNDDEVDWVYTAVEKGPGGVHAWPFVSMYLAGAEAERERGLDLLARFVARTHTEADDKAVAGAGDVVPLRLPEHPRQSDTDVQSVGTDADPPHAAPYSSDSDEEGSIGSMPSDVDLHGLVDEETTADRFAGFGAVNIADAVRRAQELGFVETDVEGDATLSESSNSVPLTPRSAARTVRIASPPVQPPPPHLSAPPAPAARSPIVTRPVAREPERERGRSRSPRKPVHMTSTPAATATDSTPFVSSVQLHRPQSMNASPSTERGQSATPLWWTGASVGARSSRSVEDEAERGRSSVVHPQVFLQPAAAPQPVASKPATVQQAGLEDGEEHLNADDDTSRFSLPDIAEASSDEAMSPARSMSPPVEDVSDMLVANLSVTIDPQPFSANGGGLSRWAIQRPEPEGLSDIAEEGSVLSASVTSAGDEDRSRSLSPPGQAWRAGHHEYSGSPSLTEAATQFMQSQPSTRTNLTAEVQHTPRQWRFLRDEIGVRRQMLDDEDADEEDGGDDEVVGDLSFSPPANAQPGRSLPLVASAIGGNKSTSSLVDAPATSSADVSTSSVEDDVSQSSSSNAVGIQARKKPKGDVWW